MTVTKSSSAAGRQAAGSAGNSAYVVYGHHWIQHRSSERSIFRLLNVVLAQIVLDLENECDLQAFHRYTGGFLDVL